MRRPLLIATILLLSGCDGWPLYARLPVAAPPPAAANERSLSADPDVASGQVQALDLLSPPVALTITGAVDFCGFDPAAPATWPLRPTDRDGDGVSDGPAPQHAGWYAGDVDVFGVQADASGWLRATLSWDGAPDGENLPVDGADPQGAWSQETDLDVVVVAWDGQQAGEVLDDGGATRAVPEHSARLLDLRAGERVAVAVACHHGVGGAYSLRLDFGTP